MIFLIHIISAWLELIFLTISIGTLACRLWVLSSAASTDLPERELLSGRMWRFFTIGVAATLVSSAVNLFARAAEMSGTPIQFIFPLLPTVILKTHFGLVWLIRITGLVLLCIFVNSARKYRDSRPVLYLLLGIGIVVAMTESASGHAADAGDFSAAELVDLLHLLAASVWGGGLFVLSLVILPFIARAGDHAARPIAEIGSRFSRIAGIAVTAIILTALYQAWFNVGSIDALVKAPSGRTIIAKIVLLILLLALGAFNRYVSVPRLREWAGFTPYHRGILSRLFGFFIKPLVRDLKGTPVFLRFARSVRIEAVLMVGVLFCAALLRHEIPAKHFMHLEHLHGQPNSSHHHEGGSPHSDHSKP